MNRVTTVITSASLFLSAFRLVAVASTSEIKRSPYVPCTSLKSKDNNIIIKPPFGPCKFLGKTRNCRPTLEVNDYVVKVFKGRGGARYPHSDGGDYNDYRQDGSDLPRSSGGYNYDYLHSDSYYSESRDGGTDRYNYGYEGVRDDGRKANEDQLVEDRHNQQDSSMGSRPNRNNMARKQPKGRSPPSFLPQNIPGITATNRKVGLTFLVSGLAITFLGISLFFNKTLLRMGNILFLAGIPLTIGPSRTVGYFLQPKKARATACLGVGIFLVLIGSPVFGIAMEIFGLLNLFGNMFPIFIIMAKRVPFLGDLIPDGSSKKKEKSTGYTRSGSERKRHNDGAQYYAEDENGNRNSERYY